MTRKDGLALELTLLFGALLGYIDLNSSEVFLPMACLLLFAFTLGAFQPKAAWRWGLLIGLSVPAAYGVASLTQLPPSDAPAQPLTLVVLVIPALSAAYAGVLANHLSQAASSTP